MKENNIILLNNCITFAMQLGWTIARNEVWEGDKNIDVKKVENYLRTDPSFAGLSEESIRHFSKVILHVID